MFRCIVTKKNECPNAKISGTICAACRVPSSTCPNCGGEEYRHYIDCPIWAALNALNEDWD